MLPSENKQKAFKYYAANIAHSGLKSAKTCDHISFLCPLLLIYCLWGHTNYFGYLTNDEENG